MEEQRNAKDMVVTQISIGGFDSHAKAKDLMEYLERVIGMIWRCRLKTSWTPPKSHPNFEIINAAAYEEQMIIKGWSPMHLSTLLCLHQQMQPWMLQGVVSFV